MTIEGEKEVQGLIGLTNEQGFIKADLVENNPHNVGSKSKYIGVGAHLFAIAVKRCYEEGYDGWVCFEAKTQLVNHYQETLRAKIRGRRGPFIDMYIDEKAARELYNTYFGEGK